jgi:hypothetical protein
MLDSARLKRLIEKKSGWTTVSCDRTTLRSKLGFDVAAMRRRAYVPSMMQQTFNERLEDFITHPLIGEYLSKLTPPQTYVASGVKVLPLDGIKKHIQHAAPIAGIFWEGYLAIATSFYENAVFFHAPSGRVVWACYESFLDRCISYQERSTGKWCCVPYTSENVEKALVRLSDDIEAFLTELLADKWQRQFAELD